MQSAGMSSESSQIRNDLTTASPTKRITFYKSGDTQFSGIRMPIHKRSFKCFDALLDDLSQKMPLPFGVRTITTPGGTHAIQNLEQLQDGACYLCSDRHYVKPIDMEAAGKRPAAWQHSYPLNTLRKPSRPDEPPTGHSGHHNHRQPKRIVLVKNNDPAVRRSIVLSRKRVRSLRVFMDEISDLMQCHVRKLYTLEGRKIDSMQSLMQCPSVLVCVGREPFKPLLLENLRKNVKEKLPVIDARSHSSICSEGHDSKKNVNFGLETKKSIIHPRSDSSNKSARFSLSSEKSYPNGSGMTPGQLGYVTKEVVMNDDIEKRVLINKDGSLSVEMKVRFRLVNDETLQWSTEIKRLPTSTKECSSLQGGPHCVQGKDVYFEPDSNAECEAEETCSPSNLQMDLRESCQNCCNNHNQGYDIWKNPLHKDDGTSGSSETRGPSNSAGLSDEIIHQMASMNSVYTTSRSSEEYTEHLVEKASCFQQTIEEGDTKVEFCSISRCCSRSEVSTSTTKCNMPGDTCKSNTEKICHHDDNRKTDYPEFDHLNKVTKVAEYLYSFKKDDYDDLSPSISRASQQCSEQGDQFIQCVHRYGSQQSHNLHSSPSPVSSCSADEVKSKLRISMYAAPEVHQESYADTESMDSVRSSASKLSSMSQCCCCNQCIETATSLGKSDMKSVLKENVQNIMSDDSKVSSESQAEITSPWTAQKTCKEETKSGNGSTCAMSTDTCFSIKSTVCPCCGGCGRLISTMPANIHGIPFQVADKGDKIKLVSQRSSKSPRSMRFNKCTQCAPLRDSAISNLVETIKPVQNNIAEVEVKHACSQNALFDFSNCSAASQQFKNSKKSACGRSSIAKIISGNAVMEGLEKRTKSAMSIKSIGSAETSNDILDDITKFGPKNLIAKENENLSMTQETLTETGNIIQKFDLDTKESIPSAMSTKTHSSEDSNKFHKSNNIQLTATASQLSSTSPIADTSYEKQMCTVSVKSNACLESDSESVLIHSDLSTGQKPSQTTNDAKCSAQNALPVASPSPKSPITVKIRNQAQSVKSVTSKASSRCNKHSCCSSTCGQRLAKRKIAVKSKSPATHGLPDEPLSPTSTASVSLGLDAEERSEDLADRSMNHISQTFDEPSCLSEKDTSEPSALDHTVNYSAITETRGRVKTAVSNNCTVSNRSKLSNFIQGPCMNTEVVSGPFIFFKSSQSKTTSGRSTAHRASPPKDQRTTKGKEKTSPSKLGIKARKTDSNSTASVIPLNTSKSDPLLENNQNQKPLLENKSEMSQNCTTPDSTWNSVSPQNPDLLIEMNTHAKPDKRESRSNTSDKNYVLEKIKHADSNCKNSSSFKQRKISITTLNKTEDYAEERLMPSSLPNASPTDVINAWLKNIPIDSPMYDMGDEYSEQHDETLLHIPDVKEEECLQNEIGEQSDMPIKMKECQEIGGPEVADTVIEHKNTICDAKLVRNKTFLTIAATNNCSHSSPMLTKRESLSNNCQSSIQVMKALLNPKLDRCNSLPEVSPTYGRKLSTSAKGLLDCLANLQVIDPDPKTYDKYSELISTLQSLWMNMPSEAVQDENKIKVHSAEEFNPISSSGVNSGSGKGSINGGLEQLVRTHGRAEWKVCSEIHGYTIMGAGCDSFTSPPENKNSVAVSSDPITPDIAERVQCSPEHEKLNKEAEGLKVANHVLKTNKHARDIKEIPSTFSTRSPEDNGNVKSLADKEMNPLENNHSRIPPSNQKGQLTKRISQDPDPVWLLSLLKKLEKQFMSHYANAIAEFKVRWDLNDNETLDTMISELKEDVHKRIQSTIKRELQKIQSRAGRTPRPPISMLSRDFPVQTEQRRRRLKVMPNKLINPLKSEDANTASGTEFSDQRSEDEYCPCDTCVKRKMASRLVQCTEALSVAPVIKDFDLRKILQTKKDLPVTTPVQSKPDEQDFDRSNIQDKKNCVKVVNEEAKVDIIKNQTDGNDILIKEETKDELIKHENQDCENQYKDVGKIPGEWRTLSEGPSDDEDDEKMFDDKESKTEREIHQVKEGLEDKSTHNHGELTNREDEEAERATEENTSADEKTAIEKEPPDEASVVERKEIPSSEIEAKKEISVVERESNDERAEDGVTEGQTNKESDTGDAEEEERDEIEEEAEIPEEGEETENRAVEETLSSKASKTSEDESGGAKNSNATSDKQTQDDVLAAAAIPKPRKNKISKIIEGKNAEEGDAARKSEVKKCTENSDVNQSEFTGTKNEIENESYESNSTIYSQKPSGMKDRISTAGQLVSEGDGSDQAEDTDHLSQICGDNSDCKPITQVTTTSVECQTGSLEFLKDWTVKEKLQTIQFYGKLK